jgi:hypothetical protein
VVALLDIAGLVDHQHPTHAPEVFHDVAAQVIAYSVVVPHRLAQQVLQTVWRRGSHVLGG